jgi:DNA replication ATP-dependent helicase Dna2
MQIEGKILAAYEHVTNGENLPFVTLDTGTALISLALNRYYRSLVQDLREVGKAMRGLKLRVYHLYAPNSITTYKGRTLYHYQANTYTLAVLEPDTLLNITDLNHAEYCARQYLLNRLFPSPVSSTAMRGNLVHASFKELLKEHDRGELMTGHSEHARETPLATLQRHSELALERASIDLALAKIPAEEMRLEVAPHLESLANWYLKERSTLWDNPVSSLESSDTPQEQPTSGNQVRAETFLLAPELGLRGRLDLLWQQMGRQRLLELKTGGANGQLPKSNHRWQVFGYHALLTARRDSRMRYALATLLYSGTPGEAQAFGIPFTVRELQRVNETRNRLALMHIIGTPPAPPGPNRCTRCSMLAQCTQISTLLDWQPPVPDLEALSEEEIAASQIPVSAEDREFFKTYYTLLQMEQLEAEQQQALLWQTSVGERIARGSAISDLQLLGKPEPTGQGEWLQTFRCVNTSELREGDEVLLSDGNPVNGQVVTGTIVSISAEQVTIWSPELISNPNLIDRYGTDIVHVRTLQNLIRWLQVSPRLRGLVAGNIQPCFSNKQVAARMDFNSEQNLAVARALQMQDYLLVHGPPGTGKTSVIAEIVKRLCAQGKRVMLAAFTNQAVDNLLKRLDKDGFHDYIRLGHQRSVDPAIRSHLLSEQLVTQPGSNIHALLGKMPVVGSTTATWSSEKYTPLVDSGVLESRSDATLHFDVVILDEAGQLTIPAILGTLRFAKSFILVGDEKQLPPLVLSKQAAEKGLASSLFTHLQQATSTGEAIEGADPQESQASVQLRVQYRMNKWISYFASKVFYEGQLEPAEVIALRLLALPTRPTPAEIVLEQPAITRAVQPRMPLVFLNVAPPSSLIESEQIKISNTEASAVREIVAALLRRGIAEKEIGIIAPYRAQVANLRRHLFSDAPQIGWKALPFDTALSIDTVDRFQGGERPVIIMSFATSSVPSAESPLRDFLTNPNRLNVALTRAQSKLILVGTRSALGELPYFKRLIAYCDGLKAMLDYTPTPQETEIRAEAT